MWSDGWHNGMASIAEDKLKKKKKAKVEMEINTNGECDDLKICLYSLIIPSYFEKLI